MRTLLNAMQSYASRHLAEVCVVVSVLDVRVFIVGMSLELV